MIINIDSFTRKCSPSNITIGYLGENKIEQLEFVIPTALQDYSKKACFKTHNNELFSILLDDNILTLTNNITKYKYLELTIEFFKNENEEQIVAKSSIINITIDNAVEDTDVSPDDPDVNILNNLISEVDNLNITSEETSTGANIIITDKKGNKTTTELKNGEPGVGIPMGGNSGQVLAKNTNDDYDTKWINVSSIGGTSNYEELENKPKINNVELNGNKTLDDLGINIPTNSDFTLSGLKEKSYDSLTDKPTIPTVPTDISAFNNDKGYITKDVNDLTNYTKTSDLTPVPTKVSELDNDKGYISSYTETDPTVPSYVKSISENDINKWNSMINSSGDQTISGVKTYSVLPVSEVLPTNNDQFTIKQYVDNSIATALGTIETTLQTINSGSGV